MQPNLSIVYSSQSGNGLLGWGWNLVGLSSISRTSKNTYYNGNYNAITFTDNDVLTLDGARLVSDATAGTYYPANNPYTKVVKNGDYFTVTTQDGVVMEYGNEGSFVIKVNESNEKIISWALNRITDTEGNYIQFIYAGDKTSGEYRISEIKYTGNSIHSKAPYNSIKFYYDKRTDANTMYVAGGKVTQSLLLTAIKVTCEGSLSKDYNFAYTNDPISRLYKISLKADGVSYNPTYIKWGATPNYGYTNVDYQLGSFYTYTPYTGDVNGDGLDDIVKWNRSNNLTIRIAQDGGTYISKSITMPSNSIVYGPTNITEKTYDYKDVTVIDRNSDGKDEILVHFKYTNKVTPR